MKKRNLIKAVFLFSIFSLLPLGLKSQITFEEIVTSDEWEAIISKAKQEEKLIFLDIYATWCGPCKMLDRDVYPDPELGTYYNSNFINIKMDGETAFGRTKAAQYALRAYPSMYYLTPDDQVLATIVGVRQAPELKTFGEKLVGNSAKMISYAEAFEKNSLNARELMEYRNILTEFGAEDKARSVGEKILESMSESEILDPEFREIVLGSSTDLDGNVFKTIKNNRLRIDSIFIQQDKDQLFTTIFDASLMKAINSNDITYRDRIINEFLPVYFPDNPEAVNRGALITYKLFDANTGNWKGFEERILSNYMDNFKNDDKFLYSEAYDIINTYSQSPEALATAGKLIDMAVGLNASFDNLIMKAYLGGINSNFEKAKATLSRIEAMELTEEQKTILNEVKGIVEQSEVK